MYQNCHRTGRRHVEIVITMADLAHICCLIDTLVSCILVPTSTGHTTGQAGIALKRVSKLQVLVQYNLHSFVYAGNQDGVTAAMEEESAEAEESDAESEDTASSSSMTEEDSEGESEGESEEEEEEEWEALAVHTPCVKDSLEANRKRRRPTWMKRVSSKRLSI